MSYSTYMYIYEWQRVKDFTKLIDQARDVLEKGVPYDLNGEYWDSSKEESESFGDFMIKQIKSSIQQDKDRALFLFCNHDGTTDEEVFRLFIMFGKIISKLCYGTLTKITSDIREGKCYLIDGDNGLMTVSERQTDFQEEMEYVFAKHDLERSKGDLEKAKERIAKYEATLSKVKLNDGGGL